MRAAGAAVAAAAILLTLGGTAAAQSAPAAGCSWWAGSNPDAVNVAYPDESAAYWGTGMLQIPETGLLVRGRFPQARYFSIHAYDPLLRPVGAIRDDQIAAGADGGYTVRIVPQPRPAEPEPNTVYAGATYEGHRNPGGFVLYRVYVPDDPSDPTGGVGLPDVSLAAGDAELPFGQCDLTAMLPDTGLNRLVRETDYPDWAPRLPPTRRETDPPGWEKFFGYGSLLNPLPANPVPPQLVPEGGGFLSNVDNEYVTTGLNRSHGDVVVLRARMPAVPSEVRYWSVCQNETYSQRYVACVADHQAVLDDLGRATIVISDPGDRPANADVAHGVNWLPWGGVYPDGRLILRQMVAAPDFAESIAQIEEGESVREAMGEFYPVIAYCDRAVFEAEGADGCLAGA